MAQAESDRHELHPTASFRNPVFNRSFPDPFVLKFGGSFYGYSTGFSPDGHLVFPVIRSLDLVQWEVVGWAMEPIKAAPPLYWAPEVTYSNGRFYLYYSCGNEVNMELRVAVSDRPDGGFADSGVRLTREQFAIDPHVFVDDDGEKYLFYATDFLSHSHIGTGTVVDRMVDWYQLEGKPRPVTRAKYDWQVYDPCRPEKGNVRWHTVEGPSVVKRKGKYFQMFSGGNWKNESYGVGYAVTESVLNSEEWKQSIDGTTVLPILRSVDDQILGPGHNSLVLGPNNRELFCVYHCWVDDERVMSVDRMDIVDDRMILLGRTVSAQPLPFLPRSASQSERPGTRGFERVSSNFLLEATVRLAGNGDEMRISIKDEGGSGIAELNFSDGHVYFYLGDDSHPSVLPRPDSRFGDYQRLWIEVNGRTLQIRLNGRLWYEANIDASSDEARIEIAHSAGVDILNLDLTEGFVDLFESDLPGEGSGWKALSGGTIFSADQGSMVVDNEGGLSIAAKGGCFGEFEFAANVRPPSNARFGFALLSADDEIEMLIQFSSAGTPLVFDTEIRRETVTFPTVFSASRYTQFRFVKQDGELAIDVEGSNLAQIKVSSDPSRIGIVTNGRLSVDMVRAIRIGV